MTVGTKRKSLVYTIKFYDHFCINFYVTRVPDFYCVGYSCCDSTISNYSGSNKRGFCVSWAGAAAAPEWTRAFQLRPCRPRGCVRITQGGTLLPIGRKEENIRSFPSRSWTSSHTEHSYSRLVDQSLVTRPEWAVREAGKCALLKCLRLHKEESVRGGRALALCRTH